MSVNKNKTCERVLRDLSGIASIVNSKMHVTDLHRQVDIFFYIDSSIQARELCSRLQIKPDEETSKQLTKIHAQVSERWEKDLKILTPEPNIVL